MRKQVVLNHVIRIASALALLVSVMTSPIRSNASRGNSHPDHLRCNFGIPNKVPAHHRPHVPAPARVMQVKALSCESKVFCVDGLVGRLIDLTCQVHHPAGSTGGFRIFQLDRTSYAPRC